MSHGISIRQRLTITHIGVTFVLLAALGWVSFFYFEADQGRVLDGFLQTEARLVLDTCSSFWSESFTSRIDLSNSGFKEHMMKYWLRRLNRPLPFESTIYLFDVQGRAVSESNHALALQNSLSPSDGPRYSTISNSGNPYRVLTETWYQNGQFAGTVSVACLLTNKNATAWGFALTLFLLLTGSALVSSFLGSFLIALAFRPVADISRAASRISETNLAARLPEPPGKDEIGLLARTLNSLLKRLEIDRGFQENLVQDLSHQLRTPLTILRGRNEGALSRLRLESEVREVLEDNLMDIDQIVSFLNTMLHLAKLENGLETTRKTLTDLISIVRELGEEMQPLWEEKELQFLAVWKEQEILWEDLPQVLVSLDAFQTRQALMNIFDNAYRYAPISSKVRVEFRQEKYPNKKERILLIVTNQGPPIPPESLDKIFKRFYRAQGEPASEGFGLGLSIARSLMESQGGHLTAYNSKEGGAAFELSWELS